jgi:hemoglobin-like flavoprotein
MQTQQIAIVQTTFQAVEPIAAQAAEAFYARLFELDPSLRRLFKSDMPTQGRMLMAMIGTAVRGLADAARLVPTLKQMGARHVGYGVRDDHYDTVGSALLWTLEQGLGEAFTPEARSAWAAAYELLAGVMKEGAAEAQAKAAPAIAPAL